MEPACIRKLDEVVINRIAAGEVIQRPSNALKELIENSIDAKSTNIAITIKSGGLKYLQIQDNGTGIRREDLEIVCERFTTSKLQTFEDLNTIATYGFRGEALSSISHVAHLTILTKTCNDKCAYRAQYIDGKLKEAPKPCAGNQGTQITVEDLFYNISTRRNALKNANDEYQKIFQVVSKYAIHNANIGFSLKKFGEKTELRTPIKSNHIDNIRIIHGNSIAKELIEIKFSDTKYEFDFHALITNANYSTKKPVFLLFINHRLVDSPLLRKVIDRVYTAYLPKGTHPFLYFSLEINPKICDVNVHPTKHEVHFLHEEQIIDRIKEEIEKKLLGSNVSRTMYIQTKLPGVQDVLQDAGDAETSTGDKAKRDDKNLVRTDANQQKLEKFFGESQSKLTTNPAKKRKFPITQHINKSDKVVVRLLSVLELRKSIETQCNANLRDLFAQHKFVGCINPTQALIQFSTKLFLCNTKKLSEELFYQFLLYDFQNFDQIVLENPLPIYDLVIMALELTNIEYNPEEDGTKEEIANTVQTILTEKAEMLRTYFAVDINPEGYLKAIPLLLHNYLPDLTNLPVYVLKMATEVNYEDEKECFDTFSRQTAQFYSTISQTDEILSTGENFNWAWVVEHIVYPALKKYIIPNESIIINGAILQVANLPDLYKVFERC
ncbi:DNA mismatch repair protein Mlh1 [Chrysoperla carnea]|uniref:DNA mismatch repair protein Mlh1 n=1 Tax=Chrysoperla carnea TaxID=189513 RepID=UPI001D06EE8D|nr:DNA mismatch repair protein Mlh1 [Chrysoperla carnea]